jgi:hypothetical protein
MVSWRDYAGVDGFGQTSVEDMRDLKKALAAGQDIGPIAAAAGVGFPLRVESLERTLKNTTYRMEHVRYWRAIPKGPAFNTVEEFNQIRDYGNLALNSFITEGALPEESDSTYSREFSIVKFMGITRRVTHVMSLVKPAHGNVIAQETIAGTMKLLRDMERNLWFARSDLDAVQFDGMEKLIEAGALAENIIDLRGAPLSEDVLIDAALTIQDAPNYGTPTHVYMNPKVKADLAKTFFPKSRYDLFSKTDTGLVGLDIRGFTSPAGDVMFEPDVFITDGDGDEGGLPTAAVGNVLKRPSTPTVTTALATAALSSSFTASDLGTYNWQVVAVNAFGQSAPVNVGSIAVSTAGHGVTFGITPGAGTLPTYYRVFRTVVGGAAGSERHIARVAASGNPGETTITDLNANLPGTTKAFMIQQNEDNVKWKQLAPMIKVSLATIDTSIRWMQLIYGVIQLYTPRRNVVFKNIGRSTGYVGAP